ncbi:MAG: DUF3141 domain-containing protein [Pikeienuella sp.]
MTNVFDLMDFRRNDILQSVTDGTAWSPAARLEALRAHLTESTAMGSTVMKVGTGHASQISESHGSRARAAIDGVARTVQSLAERSANNSLADDLRSYFVDAAQRMVLAADVLRQRGDIFLDHEAAGCPPVLIYDYEVVLDGADLSRPCNYMLLRIVPPQGVDVDPDARPFIIIDPRAGHGGGIGGFKPDSQVGVALKEGHPVYFVAFKRMPEPGQTLAHVTHAEAEFVREVMRRHPNSPNPVVTGNCQGGWATLILAAMNPDITGPICLNGAPVATWSGKLGAGPMRYNAGVLGGTWLPMLFSDLGNGVFDGAHLVSNFELLNPSRNFFKKYFDLYSRADTEGPRFLEFEKWWGGFFLLNEAEIKWIVGELFVGNKLIRNEAFLERGRPIDVKKIRSPIIVFASHGDNITPPQQALNWICDSYADVSEIQIRGQRIIYMVHEQVGHLGIFVSSSIAKREHTEVTSTLQTIEALAPGLYEMKIDEEIGEDVLEKKFVVSFHERSLEDIAKIDDGREDEDAFAAVARTSEIQAEAYDIFARPLVQSMVTPAVAELSRTLNPLRTQRAAFSSRNPMVAQLEQMADHVRSVRAPADKANPFVAFERAWADSIEQQMDLMRDMRDAMYEVMFLSFWGSPWARWFGRSHRPGRTLKDAKELLGLPEVQSALAHISSGGFPEAVIRMLILLAESRGNVRRDRLERSSRVLTKDEPFASLGVHQRNQIIYEQTLICHFEPEAALATLTDLIPDMESRRLAAEVVQYVPGAIEEMAPHTFHTLQRMREVLGLEPASVDITEDPLADASRLSAIPGAAAE